MSSRRSWGLCRRLRVDVTSGGGANLVLLSVPPPLVAGVRCRVGNQGRLPWPSAAGGCAAPAVVRRSSSSLPWNALRSSPPRPSVAVQPPRPFATLRRVCLGHLPPLAVQPPPPFKDIFQKYLDWEAEDCLEKEKERVYQYLHSSEENLLGVLLSELMLVYATQLYENEHPGLHALLRDEKVP
ncbi:hypothetical protein Scep_024806 [Stephania cephalantha]|uniref:Uncharacterized protein n=1 Tax=Stephania cephalantha TaxID=152367 RepID=A0AAP0EX86_9MAGN